MISSLVLVGGAPSFQSAYCNDLASRSPAYQSYDLGAFSQKLSGDSKNLMQAIMDYHPRWSTQLGAMRARFTRNLHPLSDEELMKIFIKGIEDFYGSSNVRTWMGILATIYLGKEISLLDGKVPVIGGLNGHSGPDVVSDLSWSNPNIYDLPIFFVYFLEMRQHNFQTIPDISDPNWKFFVIRTQEEADRSLDFIVENTPIQTH